jgi:hypothetical protein
MSKPKMPSVPKPPPPPATIDITNTAEARQNNRALNKEGAGGNTIATGTATPEDRQSAFDEAAETSKKKKTPYLGA